MTPARPWTPAEVDRLRAALEAGRTPLELARSGEVPGRSVAAIRAAAERRGLDWVRWLDQQPGTTRSRIARAAIARLMVE